MTTIGTSAIKYIAKQLENAGSPVSGLETKIVAFMGTMAEQATAQAYENSIFIVIDQIGPTTYGPAVLYFGNAAGNWGAPITDIPANFVMQYIIPAAGWADVLIKVARATKEQVENREIPVFDGFPIYCATSTSGELYVGDGTKGRYVLVASMVEQTVPTGAILYWPMALPVLPDGYVRADGSRIPISGNYNLYQVYGTTFDEPGDTPNNGDGMFRLPLHDEGICKR